MSVSDPYGTNLYYTLQAAREYLAARLDSRRPVVGAILGSGLGSFADSLANSVAIAYKDIPGFGQSTVSGHGGRLVIGSIGNLCCVVMQGRLHLYEGYSAKEVTFPARTMIALGARTLIITNAAGGMRTDWEPGTLMLIRDHIDRMPDHPLRGHNDERMGPRFPDMTNVYDPELRDMAKDVARAHDIHVEEGVYVGLGGPSYETPAEIRMLRTMGADAVGMSTVPEAIVARHMGARVLGISCITNKAAGITGEALSHDEVTATAARVRDRFQALVTGLVEAVGAKVVEEDHTEEKMSEDQGKDKDKATGKDGGKDNGKEVT